MEPPTPTPYRRPFSFFQTSLFILRVIAHAESKISQNPSKCQEKSLSDARKSRRIKFAFGRVICGGFTSPLSKYYANYILFASRRKANCAPFLGSGKAFPTAADPSTSTSTVHNLPPFMCLVTWAYSNAIRTGQPLFTPLSEIVEQLLHDARHQIHTHYPSYPLLAGMENYVRGLKYDRAMVQETYNKYLQ